MVHLNLNNEGIQTERSGEAWLPDFAVIENGSLALDLNGNESSHEDTCISMLCGLVSA